MTLQGGCCCGAIRYEVTTGVLHPTLCFCPTCRRVSGAPGVAWFSVPQTQYQLLQGEPAVFRSSSPVTRTFCAQCGTPLTYVHATAPNVIDVTTCSLDDPDLVPPEDLTMTAYRLAWSENVDNLPAYPHTRSG